jgi:hypothetical protein
MDVCQWAAILGPITVKVFFFFKIDFTNSGRLTSIQDRQYHLLTVYLICIICDKTKCVKFYFH